MRKKELIELLSKLDDNLIFNELGTVVDEEKGTKLYIYPLNTIPITWSVDDFIYQAQNRAEEDWEDIYDKTKFQKALEEMMYKANADFGIAWNTVDYYLDKYCRRKDSNG